MNAARRKTVTNIIVVTFIAEFFGKR